jgi:hypothetical protein
MTVANTQIWASKVDGVLLVVRPEYTHTDAALYVREQVHRADAKLLGVVFNRFSDDLTGLQLARHRLDHLLKTIYHPISESVKPLISRVNDRMSPVITTLKKYGFTGNEKLREYQYDRGGLETLQDKEELGYKTRLSRLQREELIVRLREVTPKQLFGDDANTADGQYWTVKDLSRAIKEWYSVIYRSRSSYYRLLEFCGFTYDQDKLVFIPSEATADAEE